MHRFYVGKIGTGVLMILTAGGFGIWTLVDLIMLIVGAFRDKQGLKITQWT
ncbi:TM2 domain-containing protein [Oerskovia sp. M15]